MGPGAISTYRATELPGVGDFEARYNSHSHLQARVLCFHTLQPLLAILRPQCRPGVY